MKKRAFTFLNFLALNVLFFAVYLSFIHKDTNTLPAVTAAAKPAFNSTSGSQTEITLASNNEVAKTAKQLSK